MALELGPCEVKFGTAGAEVDIGKTFGGVTVMIQDDMVDLKSDQFGTAPEDTVITGTVCTVEMALAEISFDLLQTVLHQATATSFVAGENNVGTALLAVAESLVLTKYVDGIPSTDAADIITFPAASPVSNIELTYDADNQRVMQTTFKCFFKEVTDNWGTAGPIAKTVLYYFGDATAVT